MVIQIELDLDKLRHTLNQVSTLRNQWIEDQHKMADIQDSLRKGTLSVNAHLEKLQKRARKIRDLAEFEADQVIIYAKIFMWGAAIVFTIFMIVVGSIIARRIIVPINKAVSFADTMAKGDLTARINLKNSEILSKFELDNKDEISTLVIKLSEMAQNLNNLIGQVQRSGVLVSSSATELAATARQQEVIMSNQSDSTQYVVQSIREISDISSELVQTMKQLAHMSGETAEFATKGQEDLSRMEEAIRRMETASTSISGKLEAINEKAANITSVVTTITKVADQTNLLSLNAAIEAEKAGEQGRGFTVVAREIRRLADQTAVATLDIEQMVKDMQSAVSAGVMEMDAFMKEVQRSAEDVARISNQLSRIIHQVQALSPSFDNVNQSMQFQSENAHKINEAMTHLGDDVQQTMESLRESFQAIEQLNEAARGLQDEVSRFKVV